MPTIDTARLAEITHLEVGKHDDPDPDHLSLTEAVAYVAGLLHSDRPWCMSPVLGVFGRKLNDQLPDDLRQSLIPVIPRLVGTDGDSLDTHRAYLAFDWLVRVYTPTWLDLAGLTAEAAALRHLARIVDLVSAERAIPVVRAACTEANSAWTGLVNLTVANVGATDWNGAARTAAWAAAWHATGDTVAAAEAAWKTTTDALRVAFAAGASGEGVIAVAAARTAAWVTALDGYRRTATEAAGRAALEPTVDYLQRSAITLFDSMITPVPREQK
jgi:hypothetical protein